VHAPHCHNRFEVSDRALHEWRPVADVRRWAALLLPSLGTKQMRTIHIALLAALVPVVAMAAGASLNRSYMGGTLGPGGVEVNLTFEEVDRLESTSIVRVFTDSAGPDVISAFLLNGICGVAKARGEKYFRAKHLSNEPLTYEVSFPKADSTSDPAPTHWIAFKVFSVARCPVEIH
jgi:hypothetical protein